MAMRRVAVVVATIAIAPASAIRALQNASEAQGEGLTWTQCCVKHGFDVPFSDSTYQEMAEKAAKHLAYMGAYSKEDNPSSYTPVMRNHFTQGLHLEKDRIPSMMDFVINAYKLLQRASEQASQAESEGQKDLKKFLRDYTFTSSTYLFKPDPCPDGFDVADKNDDRCDPHFKYVVDFAWYWLNLDDYRESLEEKVRKNEARVKELQEATAKAKTELGTLGEQRWDRATNLLY
eukprot:TRINITY_DN20160_c0_g1_i1.p1 TRINITY_DN20160_c0_g1~~TRINITY_DN20160_c0_g1_i1.p1  ORF type:complete len:254 (+),score=53.90 TRINITY_DN20160_c0_g1_i1:66-764(+)